MYLFYLPQNIQSNTSTLITEFYRVTALHDSSSVDRKYVVMSCYTMRQPVHNITLGHELTQ